MRPFLFFIAAAILVVVIAQRLFFDASECMENGFGCPGEHESGAAEENPMSGVSENLSIADQLMDPAQCPFFNLKRTSQVFEFDPLRKRTLKPIKMQDLRDIAHLSLLLSLSLPVDTSERATLPDQIIGQFDQMSECQLCDWLVFASRPSVLDSIQGRRVLATHVTETVTKRLTDRGVELRTCTHILAN